MAQEFFAYLRRGARRAPPPSPLTPGGERPRHQDLPVHWFEGGLGLLYDRMLTKRVQHGPVPTHVAIVMDGNRRFALASGLPQHAGHRRGKEKVREVMRWCRDLGIHYLTVYALSTENLTSRSPEELTTLFDLYESGFLELAEDREIHQDQVRCQAVGQLHLLPSRVVQAIEVAAQATQAYNALVFTVCLAYGARQELVDAIKGILLDHTNGTIGLEDIESMEMLKAMPPRASPPPQGPCPDTSA